MKAGSDCWARQALLALKTTTIFETLVLETPPHWKTENFDHCDIANKHKSKHTHKKPQKTQWWTLSHVHDVEIALFAKCKLNVGPILGTLQKSYYYYYYYSNSIHVLFKFGNLPSGKLMNTLPTPAGVSHQWTESINTRCNQWISLAKITLKVSPAGWNCELVARISRCGEGISNCIHTFCKFGNTFPTHAGVGHQRTESTNIGCN